MNKHQDPHETRMLKQISEELTHAVFGRPQTRRRPAPRTATPPYQVMPPLSTQQSDALKASIQADGIRIPIDVDEAGVILDGHQRLAIAMDLGIDCPRRTVSGLSATQKRHYALTVNLMRRQVDSATWGMLFQQLLDARGIKRGRGKINQYTRGSATVAEAAKQVGVSPRTARDRLKKAEQSTMSRQRSTPISVSVSWRVGLERALRAALNSAEIDEIIVHVANVLQVDIVAK
jgi:hypothetical protein